jgi:putative transposase
MPRALRHQYPGAVYHIMARGDGGKAIFENDEDRKAFLFRLGQVCESRGWRVHAWVLMGNHFHLLLETPEPNLVTGMKFILGTFSQGWNARRSRRGHVFQGRYKSVPVSAAVESPYYFRIVADYIHLNPARAGIVGKGRGTLVSYKWSSIGEYARGKGPDWLVLERVLSAFELAKDGRGRRAYVAWLEARALNEGGEISEVASNALRRGWYLGEPTFADKLLSLVRNEGKEKAAGPDRAARAHDEAEGEYLAKKALEILELPIDTESLAGLRKGDLRKVLVAVLLRQRTAVGNSWLSDRLAMGHTASVSRLVADFKKDKNKMERLGKIEEMLECNS